MLCDANGKKDTARKSDKHGRWTRFYHYMDGAQHNALDDVFSVISQVVDSYVKRAKSTIGGKSIIGTLKRSAQASLTQVATATSLKETELVGMALWEFLQNRDPFRLWMYTWIANEERYKYDLLEDELVENLTEDELAHIERLINKEE